MAIERLGDHPIKIHTRFSRSAKSGVWEWMLLHLAADADNEYATIDRPLCALIITVPVRKKADRGQAIGSSRGGLRAEIRALLIHWFHLTGGEAHDLVGADHLLPSMQADTLIDDVQ